MKLFPITKKSNSSVLDILREIGYPDVVALQTKIIDTVHCSVPVSKVHNIIHLLKCHPSLRFNFLVDMCAVDYPDPNSRIPYPTLPGVHNVDGTPLFHQSLRKERFDVVYILTSLHQSARIYITTYVDELKTVPTITDLFNSAN